MRLLIVCLLLFALQPVAFAAELFGVALVGADKASLGLAARAAGATLVDTDQPEVYEIFDSSAVLAESNRLYLGFDAQDSSFAFAEYQILQMKHKRMLSKLKRKYGEPQVTPGKFISDQLYRWQSNGVEISYQRQWGCHCSELRYVVPAKLTLIQQQHLQVQKQRMEEGLAKQQGSY